MGSFHQPSLVICDTDTLKSLPDNVFSDGCAEVIKYGAINDRDFFNELKTGISKKLENVIVKCIQSKADTVKRDERDNGCRRLLNFGHTVGHAIELRSNFSLSHGSAVAIGMVTMTRAAVNMGICPKEDLDELIALLDSNGLPTSCPFAAKELTRTALIDKKRSGDSICIILPYGIGNCKAVSVSVSSLADIFEKGLEQ
jgi:3-dehydroquinate synthase